MTLWWIGVIVFLFVILPAVALILHRLLRPAQQISAYADDIAVHGGQFGPHLAATVEELAKTQKLVAAVRPEIERYSRAIERMR